MARGNPSNRRQISASAGALSCVTAKSGLAAWARAVNKRAASERPSVSAEMRPLDSGSPSGGTG
jgi:hypothetical protein